MRVKFKMNLGTRDADKLGLKYQECQCGMDCEVCDEVGEKLVNSNIATVVHRKNIQAVPAKAAIADAEPAKIAGAEAAPVVAKPTESKTEPKPTEAKEPAKNTTKPNAKK